MRDHFIAARDPLSRSMRAEYVEHFAPLGARLRLETNSAEILGACRTSFGRYGNPSEIPQSPIVVRLLVDPAFNEVPPWPNPVFRSHGDIFYVSVGCQNTVVANFEKGYATGFLSPAMARDTVFFRNIFLECVVLTLLTHGKASTYSYVHASAVAREGRGLIFAGPSGSGKSTLAFACARRGFQVVTDDVVYLHEGENGLTVWGRPWHMRFLSDCCRFFPELKEQAASLRFDNKNCVEIEVEKFLPGQTRTRCEPEAIFFLDRSGNQATCESLKPSQALELLERDLLYDEPEVLGRHYRLWHQLTCVGSYGLRYSNDLDAAVRLLEDLLRSRRSASAG